MLGPLTCALASVAFDLHIGLPGWAGALGQWLIGCSLACHFDRPFFRSAPAFLLRILLFTLLAMLVAAALGGALGWLTALDEVSLMLGMMPGGITELPDRRSLAAVGGAGYRSAGAQAVSGDVPRRAVVPPLAAPRRLGRTPGRCVAGQHLTVGVAGGARLARPSEPDRRRCRTAN